MQAEVIGVGARFEVATEPPASVEITFRPCWRKPPERLYLAYLYTYEAVAYYAVVERRL